MKLRGFHTAIALLAAIAAAAAFAAPAAGLSTLEWELRFVKGLMLRGYADYATEVAEKLSKIDGTPQEKAKVWIDIAGAYLDAAEGAADRPAEEQQALLAKAEDCLKKAVAAAPDIATSIDYRIQKAILTQRGAAIRAARLSSLPEPEREAQFQQIDKLYESVVKELDGVATALQKKADDRTGNGDVPEGEINDIFFQIAVVHLRAGLACHARLVLYDLKPGDKKATEIARIGIDRLELASWEGADSTVATYSYFYMGMIAKKQNNHDKAREYFGKVLDPRVTPKELQAPDIAGRTYLEYADLLTSDKKFKEAIGLIDTFLGNPAIARGNESRALLYKATAYFAWALDLRTKAGDVEPPAKVKEYYDHAIAICRKVIENDPTWAGTATSIVDEWSRRIYDQGAGGPVDPIVLMASARSAYTEKKYPEAAAAYRAVLTSTGMTPKYRAEAGYYLALSHYNIQEYYEAVIAADWTSSRFSPDKFSYAQKSLNLAIAAATKQYELTKDKFDEALYIKYRKRLGEERFAIWEADKLVERGQLDEALALLKKIGARSDVYDMALFKIAETTEKLADKYLKDRDRRGISTFAQAQKLYRQLLDWSDKNPPRDDLAASRQMVAARTVAKLCRLLIGNTAETYYKAVLKNTRGGDLAKLVADAAEAMLQPSPANITDDAAGAEAAIDAMVAGKMQTILSLTEGFTEAYPDAADFQSYVTYARVMAAVKTDNLDIAEKEAESLKEDKEFASKLASVYGRIALAFDSRARDLENENKKDEAAKSYRNALRYFMLMIEKDPEQNFDMYYYVVTLAKNYGTDMSFDAKRELAQTVLDKFGKEDKLRDQLDIIRLFLADLLDQNGRLDEALKTYQELFARYEKNLEEARKTNPNSPMPLNHRTVVMAIARVSKQVGKHEEALRNFIRARQWMQGGSEEWWGATWDITDCMIRLRMYDKVLEESRRIRLLYPSFGGPDTKSRMVALIRKLADLPQADVGLSEIRAKAAELIEEILKADEKSGKPDNQQAPEPGGKAE